MQFVRARLHSVPVTFHARDFALYMDVAAKRPKPQLVTGMWTVEVNQPAELSHEILVTEQGCRVGGQPILL